MLAILRSVTLIDCSQSSNSLSVVVGMANEGRDMSVNVRMAVPAFHTCSRM